MFAELRRLHNVLSTHECQCDRQSYLGEVDYSPRNIQEVVKILKSFGIQIDESQNMAIISKDIGDLLINLQTGTVKFTPIVCIRCNEQNKCKYFHRKLCIIENSEGWANCSLSKTDLLILSKVFAILFDLLPDHVINQIKSLSNCFNKRARIKNLENQVMQEIENTINFDQTEYLIIPEAPPIPGSNPPPQNLKPHLRFKPPPQQIKYNLDHPNMIKLRCSILKELKNLHKLIELSKSFDKTHPSF